MKKALLLTFCFFLGLNVFSQKEILVPKGTNVFVKTTDIISSTSKTKQISGFITNDVVVDGQVVIKAETPVIFDVKTRKRGGVGRPGKVELESVSTTMVDGRIMKVDGSAKEKGISKRGKSIGLTVGMFFLIPPFNFLFLLKKGEECQMNPITIPVKTQSEAWVVIQ